MSTSIRGVSYACGDLSRSPPSRAQISVELEPQSSRKECDRPPRGQCLRTEQFLWNHALGFYPTSGHVLPQLLQGSLRHPRSNTGEQKVRHWGPLLTTPNLSTIRHSFRKHLPTYNSTVRCPDEPSQRARVATSSCLPRATHPLLQPDSRSHTHSVTTSV